MTTGFVVIAAIAAAAYRLAGSADPSRVVGLTAGGVDPVGVMKSGVCPRKFGNPRGKSGAPLELLLVTSDP